MNHSERPSQLNAEGSSHFLGVVLAGGASTRFGAPKAFATIGGVPIVERALLALTESAPAVAIVVGREREPYEGLGAEVIADHYPGKGPLAGLHAGLLHARDRGFGGICCVPSDAPFAAPALIRLLAARGAPHTAMLPASHGPLGYEPLFGCYSVRILPRVEAVLEKGDFALHRLLRGIESIAILPLSEVIRIGDPEILFLNVNTPHDLVVAREKLLEMNG